MGERLSLLTRGYGFMGVVNHPPFDTLKIGTSTKDSITNVRYTVFASTDDI